MKKNNAVVLIADKNYLEYTKQVFYSAHRYGNWQGDYILLVNGIDEKELKWFRERHIHIFELKLLTNKRISNWPPIIFHKFYLLHPMMKKWNKLIYLDTDTIIIRDMNHLTLTRGFAACADHSSLSIRGQLLDYTNLTKKNKGIVKDIEKRYNLECVSFNVGMMVIDTKSNSMNLFKKSLKMLDSYSDVIKYPEQALFNLLFYKKWKKLLQLNNFFFIELVYKQGRENNHSVILHFIGSPKPWQKECLLHEIWNTNYVEADRFPNTMQIGNKPCQFIIDDALPKYNRFVNKAIINNIGLFSWTTGRLIKRFSPRLYKKLKRIFFKT